MIDPRAAAIEAALALNEMAHDLVPGIRHDFGLAALDYLDAHPDAHAALAAWLCGPASRLEDPARDNVWHGQPAPALQPIAERSPRGRGDVE